MSRIDTFLQRLTEEARLLGESRMVRDEQPLTPELAAEVIRRFKEYLQRAGKSSEWAARSMGVAASTLSQVLSGSYGADAEPQIRKLDKWIEARLLKEAAPAPAGFVRDLSLVDEIFGAAKWAVKTNTIVLIHGPAGIGKSITARAIHAEMPGSLYITIKTAGQRKLAVLEMIADAMRIGGGRKRTSWELFQDIEQTLRDTGRLLIVDEVHKLEGRQKDEALHCLRDLHDATGIPMVWLGMTNIARYIQLGQAKGYEPLDQLHSRISLWMDLTEKAGGNYGGGGEGGGLYTPEDIQKIVSKRKLRVTPDGMRYLHLLANAINQGALRAVTRLLQLAEQFAGGGEKPVDAATLRGIQVRRLGLRAAEHLEQQMEVRLAASA